MRTNHNTVLNRSYVPRTGDVWWQHVRGSALWRKYSNLNKLRAVLPVSIRTFTSGYFNHSGTIINEQLALDPDYPYAKIIDTESLLKPDMIVTILRPHTPLTSEEAKLYAHYCMELAQRKYSITSLLLSQPLYQLTGRRVYVGQQNDRKIICSEGMAIPWQRLRNYFPLAYRQDPQQALIEASRSFHVVYANDVVR